MAFARDSEDKLDAVVGNLRRTEPLEALPEEFLEYIRTIGSGSIVLNFTPNLPQFLPQTDLKTLKPFSESLRKSSLNGLVF